MKLRIVVLMICLAGLNPVSAQSKQALINFENQLKPLMDTMVAARTDNQRFNANEKFIALFEEVLSYPKTFSYPFERLSHIKILSPQDKRFRIYTWNVVNDYGEYENYGFVQSEQKDEKEMYVLRLHDRSDEIANPENTKLDDSLWFGAVYYDIITTKNDNITYYTLLGWDGKDIYSQRKVIEPISIKSSNGKPTFGAAVFYKEKDRKRYVFEYAPNANFLLKYDCQFTEKTINKKKKQKNGMMIVSDTIRERRDMIVFDSLQSMYEGFESMPQYNIGAYNVNGLMFDRGKWRSLDGVLPRNKPDKVKDRINDDPSKNPERSNVKHNEGSLF